MPPRSLPIVPPGTFKDVADLDGTYLWLGPVGAAGYRGDDGWDSTFGADVSVIRIREREPIGVLGGSLGASKWTTRDGGRAWLEAVIGTRVARRTMVGLSAGAMVELSDTAHPRPGPMVGAWLFTGVTPYVRVGTVETLGTFVEIGVHIALPAIRR